MCAHNCDPAIMNIHAAQLRWQASMIKLGQHLCARMAADLLAPVLILVQSHSPRIIRRSVA
jgi:hypothetical protein